MIQLIFSKQIIEELLIVTGRPKFKKYFNEKDVSDLIDLIYIIGKVVKVKRVVDICRDPKDNFLLALSDESKADYLVTGDSDLLIIGTFKGVKIVSIDVLEDLIK